MITLFQKTNKRFSLKLAFFPENAAYLFEQIKPFLNEKERNFYTSLKNEKRKKEWCGTRILLKEIAGEYLSVYYDKNGKPEIRQNSYISITHSGDYIGVIISKTKETGTDAEIINDRIIRTAHKFIPEKELSVLKKNIDLDTMYLHWCTKETLYKMKGGGGYDFINDFIIDTENKTSGIIKAKVIKNNNTESYMLSYRFINHEKNKILLIWHS